MILAVISKDTLEPVCFIKEYSYCSYTEQYCGRGSFEIHLETNDESLPYLTFGNYVYLDNHNYLNPSDGSKALIYVVGVIKTIKNSETADFEVIISGYLTNHLLEYRSCLTTFKHNGNIFSIQGSLINQLMSNPSDSKRKMFNGLSWSDYNRYKTPPTTTIRYQNTGDTVFDCLRDLFMPYDYGFILELPIRTYVASGNQGMKIFGVNFYRTQVIDRSIDNIDGNDPVIFSFDLDNVSRLDYESDGREYRSIAVVASEGVGTDRTILEVGGTTKSDVDRIELYVDARDLQSDSDLDTINTLNENVGGYEFGYTGDNEPGYKDPNSNEFISFDNGYSKSYYTPEFSNVVTALNNNTVSATNVSVRNGRLLGNISFRLNSALANNSTVNLCTWKSPYHPRSPQFVSVRNGYNLYGWLYIPNSVNGTVVFSNKSGSQIATSSTLYCTLDFELAIQG